MFKHALMDTYVGDYSMHLMYIIYLIQIQCSSYNVSIEGGNYKLCVYLKKKNYQGIGTSNKIFLQETRN